MTWAKHGVWKSSAKPVTDLLQRGVFWVEFCLEKKKKRYVEILTPRTPESDLIWK